MGKQLAVRTYKHCLFWVLGCFGIQTGKTIRKKMLNLKAVDISGKSPTLRAVLISTFGKSFLLPIDVILDRVLTSEKK